MLGLLFVYALDGGLFNAITHYAHKVISPKTYGCNLCAVTNGMLGARRQWAQFLGGINMSTKFLHRDEFKQSYPTAQHTLPAVFRLSANGDPELLITSTEINSCRDLPALISLVNERLK